MNKAKQSPETVAHLCVITNSTRRHYQLHKTTKSETGPLSVSVPNVHQCQFSMCVGVSFRVCQFPMCVSVSCQYASVSKHGQPCRPRKDGAPTCTEAGSCERGIFPPPPSPARCSLLTFTSLSSCDSPCDSCPVLPGRGRGPMTGSSADCSLRRITMLAACWIRLGEAPCFCSCC